MSFFEYVFIAFRHIRRLKFRSWATIIGIIISILAIVALTAIGQGTQNAILEQFMQIGANKAVVLPVGQATFTDKDVNAVFRVDSVEHVIPAITQSSIVEFKKEKIPALVRGLPTDKKSLELAPDSGIVKVLEGRDLKENDEWVAFVNYYLAKGDELHPRDLKVGDKIFINGYAFRVVGIQAKTSDQSRSVIVRIPLKDALRVLNKSDYTILGVIFKDEFSDKIDEEIEKVKEALREERDISKEDKDDFTVTSTESIFESFNQIMTILQIVVIGIVSISLLIGGIGITNTMFASVIERTKEIGTLKAIGARNSDIFFIFLIEAGILGLVGGILGVLFGWLVSLGVEKVAFTLGFDNIKIVISPLLVIASLSFSFFVGIISGVAPALKAMKLKPIDALRYE